MRFPYLACDQLLLGCIGNRDQNRAGTVTKTVTEETREKERGKIYY